MAFYKTKKFYVITVVILLVFFFVGRAVMKKNAPAQYDTVAVARGDIVQTVEATGKVQSASDLQLKFETAGTLDYIGVKEGEQVKQGQLLANLRAAELNAAVAQAQANLDKLIAGATEQELDYYRAVADAAKADWDKTKADNANTIVTYESAVATAAANLKLAQGGEDSQIVNNAYEDAVALLQAALAKLDDGLTQADNILGMDNTLANDEFESYLGLKDLAKSNLQLAKDQYTTAKTARDAARAVALPLTSASAHSSVDGALNLTEDALAKASQLLTYVTDVLNYTNPVGSLTQTALDTKKTTIATARAAITTQYTNVITQKQSIVTAQNSYLTYKIAYDKAVNDLNNAQATASSVLAIKEASYNQALANLQNKLNPPRAVDLAPYRAALALSAANRDKAYLRAPMDGVVTKINKKRGEFTSATDIIVEMISPHFEIEVDVPETDVAKLKVNDPVVITLDAFGDDTKFNGQVLSIEPASTEIQDVVYYKVKVSLEDNEQQVKTGMTANVTVATDKRENALYVPTRAVRTNGEKYVKILVNAKTGQTKDAPVELGLRADDGKVEVLAGVSEGEAVIVGIK